MTPTRALAIALDVIRDEIDRRMLIYNIMVKHGLEREEGAADKYPLSVRGAAGGGESTGEYEMSEQDITIRLLTALEKIRDMARTGLPPQSMNYTEDEWMQHKLEYCASVADAAIKQNEEVTP